jgi:PAS domain-containing protein
LTLLDATTGIIQIFDKDGRYAFVNQAARGLFATHGIAADALIGKRECSRTSSKPRRRRSTRCVADVSRSKASVMMMASRERWS